MNYKNDNCSVGYGQINETFRALTKDDSLQPYISDDNFRTSNIRADDVGYNIYVFGIRYQRSFTTSQLIKVHFRFHGVVPNDNNGYALVLTNKLVSIRSDVQSHFDLIEVDFFHNCSIFCHC